MLITKRDRRREMGREITFYLTAPSIAYMTRQDSSVGVVTRYGMDGPGIEIRLWVCECVWAWVCVCLNVFERECVWVCLSVWVCVSVSVSVCVCLSVWVCLSVNVWVWVSVRECVSEFSECVWMWVFLSVCVSVCVCLIMCELDTSTVRWSRSSLGCFVTEIYLGLLDS
jgi:hypothetical protein